MKDWKDWYFAVLVVLCIVFFVAVVLTHPGESYLEALRQWGY